MDDLFRFLLLRAAKPATAQADTLRFHEESGQGKQASTRTAQLQLARRVLESHRLVRSPNDLAMGERLKKVAVELRQLPMAGVNVRAVVEKVLGQTTEKTVADDGFKDDLQRLGDTLLAAKLTSTSEGLDLAALVALRRAYTLVARSAVTDDDLDWLPLQYAPLAQDLQVHIPSPPPDAHIAETERARQQISLQMREIDEALNRLAQVKPPDLLSALPNSTEMPVALPTSTRLTSDASATPVAVDDTPGLVSALQPRGFRLNASAVRSLPTSITATLGTHGLDPEHDPLPVMAMRLEQQKSTLAEREMSLVAASKPRVVGLGRSYFDGEMGVGGEPRSPMPTGKGSVAPVGIGDLLVVKQHTLAYVGGDVAHVENVLRSEKMSRETRRLERTETTLLTESERTTEEERDTQSTERFSLKRETSDTLKEDFEIKAGLAVDARYGPMVEVKATTDIASSTASEHATKQSAEFSKDVVSRSVNKLTEKVHEQRIVKSTMEFEEKVAHGFDNTAGSGHISGVYQWVDKLMEGQVYNYGKRLMFDVMVPEPASFYIYLAQRDKVEGEAIAKPEDFTLTAAQITTTNYLTLAHRYGATGMEPPPPLYKVIAKAWDGAPGTNGDYISKSEVLPIDDGFEALTAYVARERVTPGSQIAFFRMVVGSQGLDIEAPSYHEIDMGHRTGSIAVSFEGHRVRAYALNLEVLCQRTARAFEIWQQKMHGAITQAYVVKRTEYERALATARAGMGVSITGRNPALNARIISAELKKSCISLVTDQFYDAFGAINLSVPEGYPQVDLAAAAVQGTYLRFFEQAFEWDRMTYFFYPYFWGLKKHWVDRALLDDVDPVFGDYLRAGAARVVFPVRPGFEEAVVHFLETGGIWSSGESLDIHGSTYVPIVEEIKAAQGAPGSETSVGDPWSFRLPTTLVKLRPDDKLPRWKKVADQWEEDAP